MPQNEIDKIVNSGPVDIPNKSLDGNDLESIKLEVVDSGDLLPDIKEVGLGTSGTRIFSEVYDEEYLSILTGYRRADIFDQMMRSDDVITMLLTARKNPIIMGDWTIEPGASDDPAQEKLNQEIADHCKYEFFERMDQDFKEFLEDVLSFVEHGYSLHERVHQVIKDDPKYGEYIGYRKWAWRSQRTIEYWDLDRNGKLDKVFQQSDGDLSANLYIPGEYCTIFSLRKRGDNYEGISSLRPIYGNWQRKYKFLQLLAVGIERYAINTAIGTVPAGKENSTERNTFVKMLKGITSHQNNYMTLAQGWEVDFLKNPFDVDKVIQAISREDEGMIKSFVANHLALGSGGNSGAYSLGTDLSDQFLSIIENDAEIIKRRFNKEIIKEFVDFNYGKQEIYPKLTVSGVNDKFAKEFSEIIEKLVKTEALTPTENLEVWLRERLGLPELLESEKAQIDDVRNGVPGDAEPLSGVAPEVEAKSVASTQLSEAGLTSLQLADIKKSKSKAYDQLKRSSMVVAEGMQQELDVRADDMIDRVTNKMRKAPKSQWSSIIREDSGMRSSADYKSKLEKGLGETAARAIQQARNEVPGGRKIQFAEGIKSRMSVVQFQEHFKNLPKNVKDQIKTNSVLIVDSQFTSIGNALLFAADNALEETNDVEVIKKAMIDEKVRRIKGSGDTGISGSIITAAGNSTAKVYNTARMDFFTETEAFDEVEAFLFSNPDPVTPICKDLNGTVFAKDDPASKAYYPPLHHNCKSFLIPLFQKPKNVVVVPRLAPSSPKLDKYKTL